MPRPHVLVVHNDPETCKLLRMSFRAPRTYTYNIVSTGQEGINYALKYLPDLVILDLDLPDMDGKVIIKKIRECYSAFIIILTSRKQDEEKVMALDAGADDYITNPYSTEVLFARIREFQRRCKTTGVKSAILCGTLIIDLIQCRVNVNGRQVNLSPVEHRILTALAKQNGAVVTNAQLLEISKAHGDQENTQYIRQYITQLRKKIEGNPKDPHYIITCVGVGYRLNFQLV